MSSPPQRRGGVSLGPTSYPSNAAQSIAPQENRRHDVHETATRARAPHPAPQADDRDRDPRQTVRTRLRVLKGVSLLVVHGLRRYLYSHHVEDRLLPLNQTVPPFQSVDLARRRLRTRSSCLAPSRSRHTIHGVEAPVTTRDEAIECREQQEFGGLQNCTRVLKIAGVIHPGIG
jgi:hypothetical protein